MYFVASFSSHEDDDAYVWWLCVQQVPRCCHHAFCVETQTTKIRQTCKTKWPNMHLIYCRGKIRKYFNILQAAFRVTFIILFRWLILWGSVLHDSQVQINHFHLQKQKFSTVNSSIIWWGGGEEWHLCHSQLSTPLLLAQGSLLEVFTVPFMVPG